MASESESEMMVIRSTQTQRRPRVPHFGASTSSSTTKDARRAERTGTTDSTEILGTTINCSTTGSTTNRPGKTRAHHPTAAPESRGTCTMHGHEVLAVAAVPHWPRSTQRLTQAVWPQSSRHLPRVVVERVALGVCCLGCRSRVELSRELHLALLPRALAFWSCWLWWLWWLCCVVLCCVVLCCVVLCCVVLCCVVLCCVVCVVVVVVVVWNAG